MTTGIDLADRAVFQHWYQEKLRFSDTDMIGHVNNVAFAALMESGRVAFTRSGPMAGLPPDLLVVMRRIDLEYRAELHWPAEVDIGSRLLRIGTSSFTIGNAIFKGDHCVATAVTTLVVMHRTTRRPSPIQENARRVLETYLSA